MPLQWHVFLCIYQQNTFPWNQSDIVLYVNCIMFSVSSCIFLKHWLRTETHLRLPAFVWGFEWQVWKIVRTKSYSTEGWLPRSERWVAKTTTIFCITLSPLISTSKLCQFPHWYILLQCVVTSDGCCIVRLQPALHRVTWLRGGHSTMLIQWQYRFQCRHKSC